MTQNMANLLTAILQQTDDPKKSSINKVLHLWPSHYCHFSTFITKLREHDRDTVQIRKPKIMQNMVDRVSRERALQAMAEKRVSHGQQAIRNGEIAEANSQAVDLAAFNAKEAIMNAWNLVQGTCMVCQPGASASDCRAKAPCSEAPR